MWFCEGSKIDWTAVAAIIALVVWLVDKYQRCGERAAVARLLAHMMTNPVGAAQVELAKLKREVISPGTEQPYLLSLLGAQETRKDLVTKASLVVLDLPSQFLDKADLFNKALNTKLAQAFSEVSRLKIICRLLADLPDSAVQKDIEDHAMAALKQIQEADKAVTAAWEALLEEGK